MSDTASSMSQIFNNELRWFLLSFYNMPAIINQIPGVRSELRHHD